MGWLIKRTKEKYRVWSSNVDKYITPPMNKEEVIRFLFWYRFEKLMEDMNKDIICFPGGWCDKNSGKLIKNDPETFDKYFETMKDREIKFDHFFDQIKKNGISINISDIDGVVVNTEK